MYDGQTGNCGPVTYTLKTDANGYYQLWLARGYNPLRGDRGQGRLPAEGQGRPDHRRRDRHRRLRPEEELGGTSRGAGDGLPSPAPYVQGA